MLNKCSESEYGVNRLLGNVFIFTVTRYTS